MHTIKLMSLLIIIGWITGCTHLPRVYLGEGDMRGKVVDAETQEPIKNAVVVAIWQLEGGWFQPIYTGNIALREATTDEQGNFVLESWGPRFGMSGWLDHGMPLLIAYKKDYLFGWIRGWLDDWGELGFVTIEPPKFYKSDFITVEMKKYVGPAQQYEGALPYMGPYIHDYSGKRCDWLKVPMFTTKMVEIGAMSIVGLKLSAGRCLVSEKYVDDMIRKHSHEK
jgi:hypothetical protein